MSIYLIPPIASMPVEKPIVNTLEDASSGSSKTANDSLPITFDGLSEEEYKSLEKKRKQ
jgi:hypothetical protein